jgi:hypothetical protein
MNDKPESRRRLLHWAALSSVVALVWPRSSHAAENGGEGLGARIAGSYLAKVHHDAFPLALAVITLTSDGGFISNDTSDQGAGGLVPKDGAVQGVWKKVGPRTIAAKTIYFAFSPDGIPQWIARTTGQFEFDRKFDSGTGDLTIALFPLDQDPLDPSATPVQQLHATMTARRITVD